MFRIACTLALFLPIAYAATPEDYFRAVRAGDTGRLRQLIAEGGVNTPDARGVTPLLYAAQSGNPESVKLLLAAGADVKSRNTFGATPLFLAASSPEKVRMLLGAGAEADAATKMGRTPLMIAASGGGSTESVRLLLAAGADPKKADERGNTPLLIASTYGSLSTLKLLLDKAGIDHTADKAGNTPLIGATFAPEPERVKLLMRGNPDLNAVNTFGGQVKNGPIALTQMTALILAAPHASPQVVRMLLKAGAGTSQRDGRGQTALMAAVASDVQHPKVIQMLLKAGADPNAADGNGETVLDWARKTGNRRVIRLLEAHGAKPGTAAAAKPVVQPVTLNASTPREGAERALDLLVKANSSFFREGGCVACHHQPATFRAAAQARKFNVRVPEALAKEVTVSSNAIRPLEPLLQQMVDPGGDVDTVAYTLAGLGAAEVPAGTLTDAAVDFLATRQTDSGAWTALGVSRPPFEDGNIPRTALAIRAIRLYGAPARQAEWDERIARARAWLVREQPRTQYEMAERLLGLHWAGAPAGVLKRAAQPLLRLQTAGGGWAQNSWLEPDAYATALALFALQETGQLQPSDPACRKGVEYLLRTQREDGSWYVRSRSPKFQPFFESGFPYGHDQWISATATAYAVMALAPSAGSPAPLRTASR